MINATGRIFLDPQTPVQRQAVLEVVMLGHCPGGVDRDFLLASPSVMAEIESQGYREQIEALRAGSATQDELLSLPIPVSNVRQFFRLFPRCREATVYKSRLAGARAWLPTAVEDFFHQQNDSAIFKKCWIVCVSEQGEQEAFLPSANDDWINPANASAFARALMLSRVGLLVLPDLERLQIPAQLDDIPRLRLANPVPEFLPCSNHYDDTHRERRHSEEMPSLSEIRPFGALLSPILRSLAQRRPDMHFLFTLPFASTQKAEQLQLSSSALADLARLQQSQLSHELHRLQLVYPYLRDRDENLSSACGVLANTMASISETLGPWRSVAGRPLSSVYRAYPDINQQQREKLRDQNDIGVLFSKRNTLRLDDERLPGGVFHQDQEYAKSGEVARFLGWLRRELENWGNQLLFEVDPQDPRPAIALRAFFLALYQRGALRGRLPEDAFVIKQISSSEETLIFEVAIAPAFPIDRIRISISYDKVELHGD